MTTEPLVMQFIILWDSGVSSTYKIFEPPTPTIEPEAQCALDEGRKLQAKIDAWAERVTIDFCKHTDRQPDYSELLKFAKECRACGDGGAFERDQEVKP